MVAKRLVAVVQATDIHPESRHYSGMPPEVTDADETGERLPWPRILLIEQKPDGIFLVRLAEDGRFGGDTWHMSIEEAKEQAHWEYGGLLGVWREIPSSIQDDGQVIAFALSNSTGEANTD